MKTSRRLTSGIAINRSCIIFNLDLDGTRTHGLRIRSQKNDLSPLMTRRNDLPSKSAANNFSFNFHFEKLLFESSFGDKELVLYLSFTSLRFWILTDVSFRFRCWIASHYKPVVSTRPKSRHNGNFADFFFEQHFKSKNAKQDFATIQKWKIHRCIFFAPKMYFHLRKRTDILLRPERCFIFDWLWLRPKF